MEISLETPWGGALHTWYHYLGFLVHEVRNCEWSGPEKVQKVGREPEVQSAEHCEPPVPWCQLDIAPRDWAGGEMMQLSQHFFSVLKQGETSNSCLQLKEKKEKHTKNQPTNKKTPNPTKQKPWAEVKTPWKLKTEIKERKLSLNIVELQNCRLSLRSSLGPRSLPPDLSLLANSSLRAWKEKIPICWQFAQVCSQSPSLAIKSIPFRFPTLVANAF